MTRSISLLICSFLLISSCEKASFIDLQNQPTSEYISSIQFAQVDKFCQSDANIMWMIIHRNGIVKYDGSNMLHFLPDENNPHSLRASNVNDMMLDSRSNFWLATNSGVDLYLPEIGGFRHIPMESNDSYSISLFSGCSGEVYSITRRSIQKYEPDEDRFKSVINIPELAGYNPGAIVDANDKIWMYCGDRVYKYTSNYELECEFEFANIVSNIVFDGDNGIIVLSEQKLFRIDIRNNSFSAWPQFFKNIPSESVIEMKKVEPNLILFDIGYDYVCYDVYSRSVYTQDDIDNPYKILLSNYYGSATCYDSNGNYWYAPEEGGFRIIHSNNGRGGEYITLANHLRNHTINDSATSGRWLWILYDNRYFVTFDLQKKIVGAVTDICSLAGTEQLLTNIVLSSDGRMLLNGRSRSIEDIFTFVFDDNGIPQLECRYSYDTSLAATFDKKGNLWGAGRTSTLYFAPKADIGDKVVNFSSTGIDLPVEEMTYLSHIKTLNDGNILIAYTDSNPIIFNPENSELKVIDVPGSDQIYYHDSFETDNGDIWISTTSAGIVHYDKGNDVATLVKPAAGTVSDVIKERNYLYALFDSRALFRVNNENESSLLWKDDELIMAKRALVSLPGETIGLFSSKDAYFINDNEFVGKSIISDPVTLTFTSDNNRLESFSVCPEKGESLKIRLKKIPEDFHLRLSVEDGFSDKNYEYTLFTNNSRSASTGPVENSSIPIYKLNYGHNHYYFKVSTVSDLDESPLYSVTINVSYPWYTWLIALAIVAVLSVLFLMYYGNRKNRKIIEEERREKMIQEEINRRNVDFFANMSHEFRAPLTLINGAMSELESDVQFHEVKPQTIGVVRRNVGRMLKMVTQMLDFNKLDHGMLKLNVAEVNLSSVISKACEFFEIGACQKSLNFTVKGCDEVIKGYADADKLEKIIYNLCSNALKFTPAGGDVEVSCSLDTDGQYTVSVRDTGMGLPETDTDKVFERFAQAPGAKQSGGTGIGLSFTKSLVELHHGKITASNVYDDAEERNIAGAVFVFSIPTNRDVYSEEELESSEDFDRNIDVDAYKNENVLFASDAATDDNKASILLIDDDYELINYLRTLFSDNYNVYFRFDATSGYALIDKIHPDVVVCDMMMLDVSGLELCSRVKNNISMCHIPFVMLTAKSSVDDQVKSLNVGADAYVVKPFNPQYLTALVASLVQNRMKIKGVLTNSIKTDEESSQMLSAIDKEFMDKLYETMEQCIEESEVDFSEVASMMGVSRSKLFYKVKSLTGQTPNDFFNTYKLNKAAEMIKEGKYKISAIASAVGFSSPSHFASLFKKKFGVLPSEYN